MRLASSDLDGGFFVYKKISYSHLLEVQNSVVVMKLRIVILEGQEDGLRFKTLFSCTISLYEREEKVGN